MNGLLFARSPRVAEGGDPYGASEGVKVYYPTPALMAAVTGMPPKNGTRMLLMPCAGNARCEARDDRARDDADNAAQLEHYV